MKKSIKEYLRGSKIPSFSNYTEHWELNSGVLYVAFGPAFTLEALDSIESLKNHNRHLPVMLFTDQDVEETVAIRFSQHSSINSKVMVRRIKPAHIRAKVDFIGLSPFRKTLYLDSDTHVALPIDEIFECLEKYDLGGVHDYARKRERYSKIPEYASIPYAFSEINGGVLAFRKSPNVKVFLDNWQKYFYKYFDSTSGYDQMSLRIALYESPVSLLTLPFEYNVRGKATRIKQETYKKDMGEDHLMPRIFHLHLEPKIHSGEYPQLTLENREKLFREMAVDF